MGTDRCHGPGREVGRVALLEPQHAGRQHVAPGQLFTHDGLDGPEVLPYDEGAGPIALQGQDAEEVIPRVPHVGALSWIRPDGDPVLAKEPHDVVDAQPTPAP